MGDPIGKLAELIDADDNLTMAAFVYQIGAKDYSSSGFNRLSLEDKAKFIVNEVTGRTIGYNQFHDVQQFSPTFNLGNAFNKTTFIGAGLWLASEAGFLDAKWRKRGEKIAVGGAIGGVFDDPVTSYGRGPSGSTREVGQRYSSNPRMESEAPSLVIGA